MKAIILAAGLGNRLLPLTENKPKCLVEFSGKTLLERLLKTFENCGVNDIVLVVGHKSKKIAHTDLDLVKNKKRKMIEIYSWAALIGKVLDWFFKSFSFIMHAYPNFLFSF